MRHIKTPVVVSLSEVHDLYYVRDANGNRLTTKLVQKAADDLASALNQHDTLIAQRDALVEALKQIASGSCCGTPGCSFAYPMCDVMTARAALDPDLVRAADDA